jgi:hypothetical protein
VAKEKKAERLLALPTSQWEGAPHEPLSGDGARVCPPSTPRQLASSRREHACRARSRPLQGWCTRERLELLMGAAGDDRAHPADPSIPVRGVE